MGNRANFVVVKDQDWQLYYSHWAGSRMLDALIGGPELALRYAQSLRQCAKDQWVDPLWADGGAVVDLDRRRVLFFGDELMVEMPERRAMMGVLAAVWPDYAIGCAYDGTAELAGYVGAELPPHTWDIRPELRPARDRNALCHLVSVVDATGQVRLWIHSSALSAPIRPGLVVSGDALSDCAVRPRQAEWARFVHACNASRTGRAKSA